MLSPGLDFHDGIIVETKKNVKLMHGRAAALILNRKVDILPEKGYTLNIGGKL
jgi:hypothetical protein